MKEFQKIKYFREKFAFTEQKFLPLTFSSNKKSLYPTKHGTWRILKEIQKDLLKNNIKVINNTVVESFSFKRNKIYKCKISNVSNKNTEEVEISGNILWTIGIPKLPTLFNLKLPNEKPDLPKKTVLANFITDKPIEAGELQYFHCYDSGYKTFRVNNYINYSPNAKNFLGFPVCAELLVDFNCDINNHLLDVAENELKRMGVLKKQKIVFKKLEVLEEAFPMPTLKNIRLINTMRSDIEKLNFKNLIIAGILSKENLFFQRHVLPDMYEKLFN